MGMFDKDKEIGLILQRAFTQGEHFIVWDAQITREDFPTDLGPAVQATLTVSKSEAPQERFEVTTLASAITAKVREADPEDFPARVFWTEAPSRYKHGGQTQMAAVLQFVGSYQES